MRKEKSIENKDSEVLSREMDVLNLIEHGNPSYLLLLTLFQSLTATERPDFSMNLPPSLFP